MFVSDINECTLGLSDCSQICNNTEPGYTCLCYNGYTLDNDNFTCSVGKLYSNIQFVLYLLILHFNYKFITIC